MLNNEFVFCVDSDGCAMDTMTYKHELFFGPIAADVFEITDRETFLTEWNRVNLYSKTRGVNRFVALVMCLDFAGVQGIDNLKQWVETTTSLSNASLEKALAEHLSDDLQKALDWSNEVNRQIKGYTGDSLAFSGVLEGLKTLHQLARVYVVSSANREAVEEEWVEQGLYNHIDEMYCQDKGKKEDVIAELIRNGYAPERIMMVGDSPGDFDAAKQNGTAFYPILVNREVESWTDLRETVAEKFVNETFTETNQEILVTAFWNNLEL
ncbi:HAD family hydrolase [Tuanshanicoccus lijuaniae]|uniref:HAD family hydrolase n=1 Tax=Aerococcaceae bacterium zg-1292 TaxID=2774330 RepID=UPI001BD895C2|nr:HAD family hydrolase [Aerococcaceae bacterium zg-A91]MBS4457446.1 HAD family hydrolase [Aerococcaceae bacterium zg-BR33]